MPGRREFVREVGLVTTAFAATRCGGSSPTAPVSPPSAEPLSLLIPLMPVGQTVGAALGGTALAVTRSGETVVSAVSRTCTHEGCTVLLPAAPGQTLDCPCHGSRFTTAGAVVNGPADRSLPDYPARIEGNQVLITER